MMRSHLFVNIYGVHCVVSDRTSAGLGVAAVEELGQHLGYFTSDVTKHPQVRIAIVDSVESAFTKHWRKVSWSNGPTVRFAVDDKRRIALFTFHPDVAAYVENFINSAVGEILERNGWFRIHAAGIVSNGKLILWHASRGSGKSVRSVKSLTQSQELIASDEMIYLHENKAYPFPVPIATIEKWTDNSTQRTFVGAKKFLTEIPKSRIAPPTSNYEILAVDDGAFGLASWFASFVLGLGLPQMRVYLVRKDTMLWLIAQAFRRAHYAWNLWRSGRVRRVNIAELRA